MVCSNDHTFDVWFDNSISCVEQMECDLIDCPICGSFHIKKAIMAPSIPAKDSVIEDTKISSKEYLGNILNEHFEDVGSKFADEVMAIHVGDAEDRNIQGTISKDDRVSLNEEGVESEQQQRNKWKTLTD